MLNPNFPSSGDSIKDWCSKCSALALCWRSLCSRASSRLTALLRRGGAAAGATATDCPRSSRKYSLWKKPSRLVKNRSQRRRARTAHQNQRLYYRI